MARFKQSLGSMNANNLKTPIQAWPEIKNQLTQDGGYCCVSISHTECYCATSKGFTCAEHVEGARFIQELAEAAS